MRDTLILLLIAGLLMFCVAAGSTEAPSELKAFPAAKDSQERFVIVLAEKARGEEDAFKVEIIVGQEMLTDGVNQVRLANTIESSTVEGWGYPYYEVTGPAKAMSTQMAPAEGSPEVRTFVTAPPLVIPYNSRLPVVVYVPKGFEVRYRIWTASDTTSKADKG